MTTDIVAGVDDLPFPYFYFYDPYLNIKLLNFPCTCLLTCLVNHIKEKNGTSQT